MRKRTGMSQVKFRVRRNVLLLQEFTVADMVRATGLNPESVRTELQRMKQEGLLAPYTTEDKRRERGGRRAVYRLIDDPEARLTLSQSIEAFYHPPGPPANRPTSRYYLLGRKLLDQAQTTEGVELRELLAEAERDLEIAEKAEGGSLASESVRAHLEYERARVAYLRGDYPEAERSFEALREFFAGIHDETMLRRIDEFRLCLRAEAMQGSVGDAAWARSLLDLFVTREFQTGSPLILLLLKLLRHLSQTAEEEILTAAVVVTWRDTWADLTEAITVKQVLPFQKRFPARREKSEPPEWIPEEVLPQRT